MVQSVQQGEEVQGLVIALKHILAVAALEDILAHLRFGDDARVDLGQLQRTQGVLFKVKEPQGVLQPYAGRHHGRRIGPFVFNHKGLGVRAGALQGTQDHIAPAQGIVAALLEQCSGLAVLAGRIELLRLLEKVGIIKDPGAERE